ncbi:SDR family oxidoreductase [Streptomyces sp. NPDC005963]|uniref:SDR family oxidoreductase n=1 Tax=Streptomyces sp. NPDC005963 TaxID=3156721 RepID=UPI0033CC3A5F
MIMVTGATGTVGRLVVARMPTSTAVRALVRRPDRLITLRPDVEVVQGDYADDDSLLRALQGVRRALLITGAVGGGEDERFLRAARRAGTEHVVKLSAAAVLDRSADDAVTRWQRDTEQLLRSSDLAWTLLRPRSFMSNTLAWAPGIRSEGVVRGLYGTSANACVDPRDIADVAVRALTESGHDGRAYTLTGPGPVTAVEQTRELGRAIGRRLEFVELTPDQTRAALLRRHSEPVVEALLASARRQKCGAKAGTDPMLAKLLGRAATPFTTWAVDHAPLFANGSEGTTKPRARP